MIEASTVKVSTMADDSLRIVLDVPPSYAQQAFALFGMRGAPCVIARLTQEAATASARAEQVAGHTDARVAEEKPKGGDLARLAGQFCSNAEFLRWTATFEKEDAAQWIRNVCGVKSRSEIDHNEVAKMLFHDRIRKPFAEWCRARGVAA